MTFHWCLECSACSATRDAEGLATVCPDCGAPWLVRYAASPGPEAKHALATRPWTMWRYREWMPITEGEEPVTMGEGCTPLVPVPHLAREVSLRHLWVKDESQNPTGSFKARGLSAAVTRAHQAGATRFSVPTAGNAGVATSAYGRRAGIPVHVFAPQTTPPRILEQIRGLGADLRLLDGHIGDCGKAARACAAEQGAFDISTLREPYRIEGKKTLGLEIAEQLGWELPDAIIYPTGGGTGLIGMWIAFRDLRDAGWVRGELPRLFSVQSSGCAPVVQAFQTGAEQTKPWEDPQTVAAGLRVPAPLGGPIILRAIQDTQGGAVAVSDDDLCKAQARMATLEGLDACPEGGATLAALEVLLAEGHIERDQRVILFNTGAGWLYRAD